MSMQFDKPISKQHQKFIKELFGDGLVVMDERKALLHSKTIDPHKMKMVANEVGQPVDVEINDLGEIKTLSDGSMYEVTSKGWEKIG